MAFCSWLHLGRVCAIIQSSQQTGYVYCPTMLDMARTHAILLAFVQGDPDWRSGIAWKQHRPIVDNAIKIIVVAVVISIIIFFLKDILP